MGRLLKTKKINGVEHYKFYSTISDGDLNDKWLTKDEILNFMFWDRFRNFLESFTADSLSFPDGYFNKKGLMIHGSSEFGSTPEIKLLFYKNQDFFEEKLKEVMSSINISMVVKDTQYKVNIPLKKIEEPKVILNDFDYFDVIEFDCHVIHLKTTPDGGTFFTTFPISSLDYREQHPTKAGVRIYDKGNYTNFDIFDDYGCKSVVKIHKSLESIIEQAINKVRKENLILS